MSENLPANPLSDFVTEADKHFTPQTRVEGGYLKFNGKTGEWSMGQEETPVEDEVVLINSTTMEHGYQRWGEIPPAKAFGPINRAKPEAPEPIDGVDQDGKSTTFYPREARMIRGAFLDEDLGQFAYNTDSMGGVERVDELFQMIINKARDNTPYCFPKVRLDSDFYKRATGKVYKPVFTLIEWCDQNGDPEPKQKLEAPADDEDDAPEDDKPTRRRRKRAA